MLKISYKDRVSKSKVLKMTSIEECDRLLQQIKRRKLSYFEHVCRQSGEKLPRMVTEGTLEGNRTRGRPRSKWTDNITKWTGVPLLECRKLTSDRKKWKEMYRTKKPAISSRRSTDKETRIRYFTVS